MGLDPVEAKTGKNCSLTVDCRKVVDAEALLIRALDQLYLLGYDSGFTNPAIEQLVTDIKFYLNGGKLNGAR